MSSTFKPIKNSADDWELYGDYHGSDAAATAINKAFNEVANHAFKALNEEGRDAYLKVISDGQKSMATVMRSHAKSGADDTEPLYKLKRTFINTFSAADMEAAMSLPAPLRKRKM